MRGLTFPGDREVGFLEVPDPIPGPGEVVVEMRASGMCGSDLHPYRAPRSAETPAVIVGHEPAGVVIEVGPGVPEHVARVGDRVMIHHYVGCGVCAECRSGWTQMCRRGMELIGTSRHGGHAPYLKVPASTLVRLPDELDFIAGAAISCGTGTAWGGLRRLGDVGGATVVVVGQGPVGLSATMLGAALGAHVIAVDPVDARLDLALEFGATHVVNPVGGNVVEEIRDLTHGLGTPLALETSGSSPGIASALASLAPWGRLCLVGIGGEARFPVAAQVTRQPTIMVSWSMSSIEQERCAEFVVDRSVPVDRLFTHRWRLDQGAESYMMFDKQSAGKAVFLPG